MTFERIERQGKLKRWNRRWSNSKDTTDKRFLQDQSSGEWSWTVSKFYSLMVVQVRSETVREKSAASILRQHIRGNRAPHHAPLDKQVMLHWNAPPLHPADPFIKSCVNNCFSRLKEKHGIFFKEIEQHRLFKLVSSDSVVLNRLRKEQVERMPMSYEQ